MSKKYKTEEYIKFLSQPFKNNFGIKKDDIANWFMAQNGAQPVIRSYGVTKKNLLDTYIPKLEELLGGYTFFLAYTVTESGGAGNWINHYARDTGSNGLECLIHDCEYLIKINKEHHPVSLSAPEVFAPAVEDEPGKCQAVYDNLGVNTIGKVFMPSTMAGNAWVFATNWCNQNRGGVPYVYFGNPYDTIIDMIKNMGGDPFGGVDQKAGKSLAPSKEPSRNTSKGEFYSLLLQLIEKLKEGIEDIFDGDLHDVTNNRDIFTNHIIKVESNLNNLHASLDLEYLDSIFKPLIDGINSANDLKNKATDWNSKPRKRQAKNDNLKTNQKTNIQEKVNAIRNFQGQYLGDGQCYALVSYYSNSISNGYHISYSLGNPPAGFAIGDTLRASNIGSGWNWGAIGWTVKEGKQENIKVGDIFNVASYAGGIWQTGEYGHTGVITGYDGSNVEVTDQNYLGYSVSVRSYPVGQFISGITSLISPP